MNSGSPNKEGRFPNLKKNKETVPHLKYAHEFKYNTYIYKHNNNNKMFIDSRTLKRYIHLTNQACGNFKSYSGNSIQLACGIFVAV